MKNILVKFPSRSRPDRFFEKLDKMREMSTLTDIHYLITIDKDDTTMNNAHVLQMLSQMKDVQVDVGQSTGKVHAINRGMFKVKYDWDILLLMSDDMTCVQAGWDVILREEMKEHFPDGFGVLWHSDGYVDERLNTMPIMGRKYYDAFGYIYNPQYISLHCDNEFMDVANILGKQKYFPSVLFRHDHPANDSRIKKDALLEMTESYYHQDAEKYRQRKSINFGI